MGCAAKVLLLGLALAVIFSLLLVSGWVWSFWRTSPESGRPIAETTRTADRTGVAVLII